jgi:hypothetical protein
VCERVLMLTTVGLRLKLLTRLSDLSLGGNNSEPLPTHQSNLWVG